MKKILSVILVVLTLLSLTACGDTEAYLLITAPGTYELQVFNEDNPKEKGEYPVNNYLRANVVAAGENIQYVANAEMYGCEKVGAHVTIENPFIWPAKYENASVTLELIFSYRAFFSRFNYRTYVTDPVEVTIQLDETGYGEASVMVDIDPTIKTSPYMNGLAFYVSGDLNNKDGIRIDPISSWIDATGTVTFYEKVDPTPKPLATKTPTASATPEDVVEPEE